MFYYFFRYEVRTTGRRTVRKYTEKQFQKKVKNAENIEDYEFGEDESFILDDKIINKRGPTNRKIRERKRKRVPNLFLNDSEIDD